MKPPEEDEKLDKLKRERAGVLSQDPLVVELFDTSVKVNLIEAFQLLSQRKFEEAYAMAIAAESIQTMGETLKQPKVESVTMTSGDIKI